ncbi:hypothetical protein SpCBS45565_g05040 [Spizellomyces sp. 'palustris']|nr:hypothetical protein SpCBS45565_g05040 [Spizellomyces sp. 'palustris']
MAPPSAIASLPPLPTASSSQGIYASEDHEVLESNYLRFQRTLLTAVDGQMTEIEAKLREKENAVKMTEGEKKEIGVELYKAKKEMGKLNEGLGKVRNILQQNEADRKILETDREAAEREIARMIEHNKSLANSLEDGRRRLDDSSTKLGQMGQVNAAYFSSIKIQRRVEEKLKKELELTEERRKATEVEMEELKKRNEGLLKSKQELEDLLTGQRGETTMAQGALHKMQRELRELAHSKRSLEKNWEDAIAAMAKRDATFQLVEDSKDKMKEKLMVAENEFRVMKAEKMELERNLREKELECQGLHNTVASLRGTVNSTDSKSRDIRGELVEAQVAESLYRQELDRVNKHHEIALEELERKTSTVSELKARLDALKQHFEEKTRNETVMQIAKKEEQIEAQAAAQVRLMTREEEAKNVNLRHDNADLRIEMRVLQSMVSELRQERDAFKDRYEQINSHYVHLYDESKHIIYALERKEHDVNMLKSQIHEHKRGRLHFVFKQDFIAQMLTLPDGFLVDKSRSYLMELQSVQKELAAAHAENERLQNLWLQSQKSNLKGKESTTALEKDNQFFKTQLGITDTIRAKTANEIAEAKKEAIEQKLEASKLYNELKKLQPVLEELKTKNVALEKQLIEARTQLEENGLNHTTSSQMLKTEIRRLYADRSDVRKARMADERATHGLERKYVLAREMVDKLKAERYELQKTNYELKNRAEQMERRYFDAKAQSRRNVEGSKSDLGTRISSAESKSTDRPAWASFSSTPGGGVDKNAKEPPPTITTPGGRSVIQGIHENGKEQLNDIPDLQAWRLKIETLTSERQYLMNENDMLKHRTSELSSRVATLEKHLADMQQRWKTLEREREQQQAQLKTFVNRCSRAEKVAAHLEKQFKEARPNSKIDYQMLTEAEPSTQLLAALMPRVQSS